jgi:mannose-6-phosphate isomerase-like protein (cupin superfamily)
MSQADTARQYLQAFTQDLAKRAQDDPALLPFVAELNKVDTTSLQREPLPRLDHPAMKMLDRAVERAEADEALLPIARKAAHELNWSQVYAGGGDIDPAIVDGMMAAQAAGSYGCFAADNIATGQFLLTPGVHYPLHTHAAREIYYCISGRIEIQHGVDGTPFALTPGKYSITPPHRLHALTVGEEPVLLLYAWIGEINVPLWIWSQDDDDVWWRQSWRRPPGKSWTVENSEPVSPQAMREAHD